MKKWLLLIIIFTLVVLMGCTSIRQFSIKASEEDMKNAETTRIVAKNLLSTWKLNSGFIKGAIGDNINQLPMSAVQAMVELDQLADTENLNDMQLGYSLGLRVRALSSVVQEALRIYAPKVLQYLPSLLAL